MRCFFSLFMFFLSLTAWGQSEVFDRAYNSKTKTLDFEPYAEVFGTPENCSPAALAALEDCRLTKKVRRLLFHNRRYRFRPDGLRPYMTYISNNGAYERCFAFDLTGLRYLEIDGRGALFLFHGFVCPFYVCEAEDIELRNLRIDYDRTFHSEGHIVGISPEYIDLKFSPEYPYRIDEERLHMVDEEGTEYPWFYLLEFNPKRLETEWKVNDQWTGNSLKAIDLGNRTVRLMHPNLRGTVGNVMNLGMAERRVPAITVSDSKRVSLHDITIYHAGGMGIIAQRSRDLLLERLVVEPAPGKDRVVSAAADAMHFVNCSGYIRMYDCRMLCQTDDATNIHGVYYRIAELAQPNRLIVELANDAQRGFDYLKKGLQIEFVCSKNLQTYAHAKIKDAHAINTELTRFEVNLENDIPEDAKPMDAIAGCSEYPEVHIRGCYFGQNRARGLLLGSRAKMLIEDCTFHNGGPALLMEGDARYWFEQAGVRDVTIRNNLFDNCYYGHWGTGVISVGTGLDRDKWPECRYNQNVKVLNNTFRLIQQPVMDLYCLKGLTLWGNRFVMSHDYPNNINISEPEQLIRAIDCDDLDLQEIILE